MPGHTGDSTGTTAPLQTQSQHTAVLQSYGTRLQRIRWRISYLVTTQSRYTASSLCGPRCPPRWPLCRVRLNPGTTSISSSPTWAKCWHRPIWDSGDRPLLLTSYITCLLIIDDFREINTAFSYQGEEFIRRILAKELQV